MPRPSTWDPLLRQLASPENRGQWKVLKRYDSFKAAQSALVYVRNRYVADGFRFKTAEKDGRHVLAGLCEPEP